MSDPTRPARFQAPSGITALLICPAEGMMCVGRSVDSAGRGKLLFAGRRPDGQWPTPQGWLPNWLADQNTALGQAVNGPGTAGDDDSGWRVGYEGVSPTAILGNVYGRGSQIGVWQGGVAELSVFWLEDSFPDKLVNLDPALFIPGLNAAIPPVSIGPNHWRVPAIVTDGTGREAQGSINITSERDGSQTGVVRSGRVVAFAAGPLQALIGWGTGAANRLQREFGDNP